MMFYYGKKRKSFFKVLGLAMLVLCVSCSEKTNAESISTSKTTSTTSNDTTLKSTKKVTFIELGSVGCVPCQAMVPVMDQMREELSDQVEVVFYDVWTAEGQPYGQKFGIRVIPTQVFLDKNGNEYYRHEGYFPIEEVYAILKQGGVDH